MSADLELVPREAMSVDRGQCSAGARSIGRLALHWIRGERVANALLDRIKNEVAKPDALAHCADQLAKDPDALKGFFRRLQKALESPRDARVTD